MNDFHFDRRSLQEKKGLNPVACAALSGDAHLVAQLVQQKACLQTSARLIPEIDVFEGYTPAHFACLWGLMQRCSCWCCGRTRRPPASARPAACRCRGALGAAPGRCDTPLGVMAFRAADVPTIAKLLDHRADVNERGPGSGLPPLSWLAVNLSNPHCTWASSFDDQIGFKMNDQERRRTCGLFQG